MPDFYSPVFTNPENGQDIARWFSNAHKEFFGNGPQAVGVALVEKYLIIVAIKVLNKFEKSLVVIPDGPKRVSFTRNLLFQERKDDLKVDFEQSFHLSVAEIRYVLSIEQDKSFCILLIK